MEQIRTAIEETGRKAREASRLLLSVSSERKNSALRLMADLIDSEAENVRRENEKDLEAARKKGVAKAMIDRLTLSPTVMTAMKEGLLEVAALPDPVGAVEGMIRRPNGLMVGRMAVPLGVIGMIYEARPNVTVDAAALCIKAGNCTILRGGSEAFYSNKVLASLLQKALRQSDLPEDAIQVVDFREREAVNVLLQQEDNIDLIIPRGGEGLIRFVTQNSRIPVLKHYKGVCHVYVDQHVDMEKALPIINNAKVQRPGVCNALEGMLIHERIAADFLPRVADMLNNEGVTMLGCKRAAALSEHVHPAEEKDWGREFLDLTLCVKIVSGYDEAKKYIERYGSQHTECILTEDYTLAHRFIREIDASAVMVNASTRFNDGGQLGLGAEIGISTTKLHAYGPMGLGELVTKKFVVFGEGQVRN